MRLKGIPIQSTGTVLYNIHTVWKFYIVLYNTVIVFFYIYFFIKIEILSDDDYKLHDDSCDCCQLNC
jgi:hypothetical protein